MSDEEEDEENVITYETFRKFHRKEKNNDELQDLPEEFYSSCKRWLERKDSEFDRSRGDTTPLYELENVKRIIRDIFDRRERKIMLMALQTVRSDISPKNLMSEEKDFYDEMVSILRDYRKEFLGNIINVRESDAEDNEDDEKTVENEEEVEEESEDKEEVKKDEDVSVEDLDNDIELKNEDIDGKIVRIFEEMPQFLDESENKWGPFKKEDLVKLPENIADLLIEKEKAEEVEV